MYARNMVRMVGIALMVVMLVAVVHVPVYSQAQTPHQPWAGEHIQQASMNWADYAEQPAVAVAPKRSWAGEHIQQASMNWADYAEQPALVEALQQPWVGDGIHEASMNWADFAKEPVVVAKP